MCSNLGLSFVLKAQVSVFVRVVYVCTYVEMLCIRPQIDASSGAGMWCHHLFLCVVSSCDMILRRVSLCASLLFSVVLCLNVHVYA